MDEPVDEPRIGLPALMLGYADYRSPLSGLYMCGSGTHPGGGVTGAPGHNAARAVLKDFRLKHA